MGKKRGGKREKEKSKRYYFVLRAADGIRNDKESRRLEDVVKRKDKETQNPWHYPEPSSNIAVWVRNIRLCV